MTVIIASLATNGYVTVLTVRLSCISLSERFLCLMW